MINAIVKGDRPLLLDLFCRAGGISRGAQNAGFVAYGVDIERQRHYIGDWFYQGDALDFLRRLIAGETVGGLSLADVDAIHASPPCQDYSKTRHLARKGVYPRLIEPVRELLIASGKPYCIENVPGAPLRDPLLLCGQMFGLNLYRHRLFETSFDVPFLWDMPHGRKQDKIHGPYDRRKGDIVLVVGKAQYKGYLPLARAAMGIDWMNSDELAESIPPAYGEYVFMHLLVHLEGVASR